MRNRVTGYADPWLSQLIDAKIGQKLRRPIFEIYSTYLVLYHSDFNQGQTWLVSWDICLLKGLVEALICLLLLSQCFKCYRFYVLSNFWNYFLKNSLTCLQKIRIDGALIPQISVQDFSLKNKISFMIKYIY